MVQDARSSVGNTFSINLVSPEGVVEALRVVRLSTASTSEKRELRDLIFSYSNSGGDQGLRQQLEERLRSLTIDEVLVTAHGSQLVPDASAAPVPTFGFSSGRPTPQFSMPRLQSVTAPQSTAPVVSATAIPQAPTAVPATPPTSAVPVKVPVVPAPVRKEVPPPAPSPVVPTITPIVPVVPTTITESVSPRDAVPLPPVDSEATPSVVVSLPEADMAPMRERIAVIKQQVNTLYGNPVSLTARDKAIGTEYMAALLEAMKAVTNAGGNPVTAMARLEASFGAIEKLSSTTPSPLPPASRTVAEASPVVEISSSAPILPTIQPVLPSEPVSPSRSPETNRQAIPLTEHMTHPESVTPVMPPGVATRRGDIPQLRPAVPPVGAPLAAVAVVGADARPFTSVAAAAPLLTPTDLPTAADMKARSGITDPLLDPAVDAGLEQLLSEWSLFKKSGLFGTGPHGRQHPLFLKIAPIAMNLIVAGRFEGVTPEIKQSITDYMNGWRYEQGIIYNNDESFETYLRRVIRHILDLQRR